MRSVKPWTGRDDDEPVPPRVRLRVYEAKLGRCHRCTRKILAGEKWTLEHLIAIENGGQNAETNLGLTCCNCLGAKNAEDAAEKSKVATIRKKHLGLHKSKRPFPKPNPNWVRVSFGVWERKRSIP